MRRAVATWIALVLFGLSKASPLKLSRGSIILNDRVKYHAHALNVGMCRRRSNPQRVLVVPGPEVISRFSVCQGRNEFGELISDTSGSVYCNGTVGFSSNITFHDFHDS